MQIRTRLTFWFIAITALLLLSSLCFIYYSFSTHLKSEFYRTLQSKALMTVAMLVKHNPEMLGYEADTTQSNGILSIKENIIIYDKQLKKLFSFNNEDAINPNILQSITKYGTVKFTVGQYEAIGITYATNQGKELIIIAKGVFLSDELMRLRNILYLTFFVFLTLIAAGGYYFSGKALQPITKTMNEIDNILPSDLSKRLNVDRNKDELSRLAQTFNQLLDRIEEAFNIQKGFIANVSHEIRNPLASIIANIQVNLAKDRSKEEYVQCLGAIVEDATELEHTSTQLMELARIASKSDQIIFGKIRLDEIIWQSITNLRKTNPSYQVKMDMTAMPEDHENLVIHANESLLKTAFLNLLENACKFSPDHAAIVRIYNVSTQSLGIEIMDTAKVIDAEELQQIFKPFYRSNNTKNIKGYGIGLSLVATILKIHEAPLQVKNQPVKGNIFSIQFTKEPNGTADKF